MGVLGVAALLFVDADEGLGVFAGAAFLKKPSKLDCLAAGLLILRATVLLYPSTFLSSVWPMSLWLPVIQKQSDALMCFCCLFIALYARPTGKSWLIR